MERLRNTILLLSGPLVMLVPVINRRPSDSRVCRKAIKPGRRLLLAEEL